MRSQHRPVIFVPGIVSDGPDGLPGIARGALAVPIFIFGRRGIQREENFFARSSQAEWNIVRLHGVTSPAPAARNSSFALWLAVSGAAHSSYHTKASRTKSAHRVQEAVRRGSHWCLRCPPVQLSPAGMGALTDFAGRGRWAAVAAAAAVAEVAGWMAVGRWARAADHNFPMADRWARGTGR